MKKTILSAILVAMSLSAMADATQTVTIDGAGVDKQVASLSFDGDNVVVTFSSGDTQTVDIDALVISLDYSTIDGIAKVESDTQLSSGKIYNISGQYVGTDIKALNKGIYIVNGKKFVVR